MSTKTAEGEAPYLSNEQHFRSRYQRANMQRGEIRGNQKYLGLKFRVLCLHRTIPSKTEENLANAQDTDGMDFRRQIRGQREVALKQGKRPRRYFA